MAATAQRTRSGLAYSNRAQDRRRDPLTPRRGRETINGLSCAAHPELHPIDDARACQVLPEEVSVLVREGLAWAKGMNPLEARSFGCFPLTQNPSNRG